MPEPGFPRKILGSHEKSRIERLLMEDKGHIEYMLPNVTAIKCVWAQESAVRRHTADMES